MRRISRRRVLRSAGDTERYTINPDSPWDIHNVIDEDVFGRVLDPNHPKPLDDYVSVWITSTAAGGPPGFTYTFVYDSGLPSDYMDDYEESDEWTMDEYEDALLDTIVSDSKKAFKPWYAKMKQFCIAHGYSMSIGIAESNITAYSPVVQALQEVRIEKISKVSRRKASRNPRRTPSRLSRVIRSGRIR